MQARKKPGERNILTKLGLYSAFGIDWNRLQQTATDCNRHLDYIQLSAAL